MEHSGLIAWSGVFVLSIAFGMGVKSHARRASADDAAKACSKTQIRNFEVIREGQTVREIPIWRLPGSSALFFEAGMTIDADGAPNAYHPQNLGLDDLANAGEPGHWMSLVKDENGEPVVQGPGDPFPGYYVSTTALSDRSKSAADPYRYVDASKIPYIVLPRGVSRDEGARLGDFAVVFNLRNGKSSHAIFADVGPMESMGEGSIALAENLGVRSDPRRGGTRGGILYIVFTGSGNGKPRSLEEINDQAEKLFEAWGGPGQLAACSLK